MPEATDPPLTRFAPHDDASQPEAVVDGYRSTRTRTPSAKPLAVALGLTELTGRNFAAGDVPASAANLAVDAATGRRAAGQLIVVSGRVLDEDERPVRGSLVEIWQANAAGRYRHATDENIAPLDPDFVGVGRTLTDDSGRYSIITIKPGAYPVTQLNNWWRPPHLHVSLFGSSTMSRLVTQMYFPGEPLNAADRILNAIPDAAARERVICRVAENPWQPLPALAFTFDLVLRGRRETPWQPG